MDLGTTVLIDFEEAFNSFTGIPISVVNDTLCIANSDTHLILWYNNPEKTKLILEWLSEFFTEEQRRRITLLNTRPRNSLVWLSQVLPRRLFVNIPINYAYSRLFPRLPISGDYVTILRIDDPFGKHSSAARSFFSDIFSGMNFRPALARMLRTFGWQLMNKKKLIKVFNSQWTMNLWNSIYKDVSEGDVVIYPPVQFSIDDYYTRPEEVVSSYRRKPYFLIIGGQRQRKDPLSILQLWASNLDSYNFDFVLVGKVPENLLSTRLMEAIGHQRLTLLQNISRVELRTLMKNSKGILFNSNGEGFGNPIAEAIYLKLNLICNDLEVFREVAGNYPRYFESGNYLEALRILDFVSKKDFNIKAAAPRQYTFAEAVNAWHSLVNR